MSDEAIFKVVFLNQGKVLEIYARSVRSSGVFGFIEIEELLFGERSQVVVDPTEESLKTEFKGVRRTHVPMHSVVRIDEVEKQGVSRITGRVEGESNLMPFPTPVFDKPSGSSES